MVKIGSAFEMSHIWDGTNIIKIFIKRNRNNMNKFNKRKSQI